MSAGERDRADDCEAAELRRHVESMHSEETIATPYATPDGLTVLESIAASLDLSSEKTTWTPSRPINFNFKAWGVWECWEHAKIGKLDSGAIGAIPTSDWIAWNACTGQQFGFPSREKAEMMAVLQNENAPTRVVLLDGSCELSTLDFDEINQRVSAAMR